MTQDSDSAPKNENADPAKKIRDSAQQIWLAGLGAFTKAQQEGAKAFESLVKEGMGAQKKTQNAAEDGFAQARSKVAGFADDFSEKAAGQWGKLENIFEDRVARALEKLGMPSAGEVAALQARVDLLSAQVEKLQRDSGKV